MYPAEKMSALSVFKFFYSIFEWGTLAEIADTDYRGFFSKHRFLIIFCLVYISVSVCSSRFLPGEESSISPQVKVFLKDKSFDTSFMGHCCLDIR